MCAVLLLKRCLFPIFEKPHNPIEKTGQRYTFCGDGGHFGNGLPGEKDGDFTQHIAFLNRCGYAGFELKLKGKLFLLPDF